MDGSTLAAVKAALLDRLVARPGLAAVRILASAPVQSQDTQKDGVFDAIWFGDAEVVAEVVALGSTPLRVDESGTVEVIVQSQRHGSAGTQPTADAAATAMLGELLGVLSADPTLGITAFPRCEVVPAGWRHMAGHIEGTLGYGSRYEVRLQLDGRLELE